MHIDIKKGWLLRRAAIEDGHEVHACNCIGPQDGKPVCPCRMLNVIVKDGRYIEVSDLGPVKD